MALRQAPHRETPRVRERHPVGEERIRIRVGSMLLDRARYDCEARHRHKLSVELPNTVTLVGVGCRNLIGIGDSAKEAFEKLCEQVSSLVFPEADRVAIATEDFEKLLTWLMEDQTRGTTQTQTKQRQKTIGMTTKSTLVEKIRPAGRDASTFAETARALFTRGFEELDSRLDSESSTKLFAEFESAYNAMPGADTDRWMLRIDRKLYDRTLVLANEQGRSLSNIAALCIARSLRS